MRKENLKFNFKRVYLNKNNNVKKNTTLTIILKNFIEEKLNKKEIIAPGEKEVILTKAEILNNDDIFLTYELINFGKKSKIKDRNTLTETGELKDNQYLEKYQYIYLNKKDNDSYNIICQLTKQGISYKRFYTLLYIFYEEFKKKQTENLADTLLLSSSYYSKDFFEKISEVNMVSSLTIEGGFDNPDLEFAGFGTNPIFKCTTTSVTKVKPMNKRFGLVRPTKILDFIKEKEKEYKTVKIKLHGKDIEDKALKIYSDNLELTHEIKINIYNNKEMEYNEVKLSLQKDSPLILEQGWVEIASN